MMWGAGLERTRASRGELKDQGRCGAVRVKAWRGLTQQPGRGRGSLAMVLGWRVEEPPRVIIRA